MTSFANLPFQGMSVMPGVARGREYGAGPCEVDGDCRSLYMEEGCGINPWVGQCRLSQPQQVTAMGDAALCAELLEACFREAIDRAPSTQCPKTERVLERSDRHHHRVRTVIVYFVTAVTTQYFGWFIILGCEMRNE